MIQNKSQLVELLMEILTEKAPKKNTLQKNKPLKNKFIKNKTRKPKKLRDNTDIWNNSAFHNASPELQERLKELHQMFIDQIMHTKRCTEEEAEAEWIKQVSNFRKPDFAKN